MNKRITDKLETVQKIIDIIGVIIVKKKRRFSFCNSKM